MTKLDDSKITEKLKAFTGWELKDGQLVKTYRFADFMDAIQAVNKVAIIAESHDHHPDILIHYNQVTFTTSTHDANGITEKDFKLIKDIESLAALH